MGPTVDLLLKRICSTIGYNYGLMTNIPPNVDPSMQQAAKQLFYGLLGVFKKLNLYSGSHTVYHNSLEILNKLFEDYCNKYGPFRLGLEGRNIIHHDTLLYEGTAEPTDLAFLLHRDGFLWIEFQKGLQLWEIDTLLKIFQDYSVLDEDPADDIVTALWEVNLPAISYEAADLELGLPDDINIDELPCVETETAGTDEQNSVQEPTKTPYTNFASNILGQDGQNNLWELTDNEQEQLRHLIAAEEKLDGSDYAIDALLYILENHCIQEDIAELLSTLIQELYETLINARFDYLLEAVLRLKKDILKDNLQTKWLAPYLSKFFAKLETKTFLNGLLKIPAPQQAFKKAQLKDLKRFLLQLNTSLIKTLGPLMLNIQSPELQRSILEVIGTMAKSDFGPLENLIAQADTELVERLVFILGYLKDTRSRQVLSKLLGHTSASVRRSALKAILTRDDKAVDEIFVLIDDPDEKIRMVVLNRLGRDRSSRIESKLLDYLHQYALGTNNDKHFIAVCRTLGRCGSGRSEPYLMGLLFKWPLLGMLRSANSIKRRGAVVALKGLQTRRARWLIFRSNRGFWRNILRSANSSAA